METRAARKKAMQRTSSRCLLLEEEADDTFLMLITPLLLEADEHPMFRTVHRLAATSKALQVQLQLSLCEHLLSDNYRKHDVSKTALRDMRVENEKTIIDMDAMLQRFR